MRLRPGLLSIKKAYRRNSQVSSGNSQLAMSCFTFTTNENFTSNKNSLFDNYRFHGHRVTYITTPRPTTTAARHPIASATEARVTEPRRSRFLFRGRRAFRRMTQVSGGSSLALDILNRALYAPSLFHPECNAKAEACAEGERQGRASCTVFRLSGSSAQHLQCCLTRSWVLPPFARTQTRTTSKF